MHVKRIEGLPKFLIKCDCCSSEFTATVFSRAFTPGIEFICIDCGVQAFLSHYSYAFKYAAKMENLSSFLKNCACGGEFKEVGRQYGLYRCPKCKHLLDEELVISHLGVNRNDLITKAPFCGNLKIKGEEISYTNPGIETVGYIEGEFWDTEIEDADFQKAIDKDRVYARWFEKHCEKKNEIEDSIRLGDLPNKLYLIPELKNYLFFKIDNQFYNLKAKDLGVEGELDAECITWAKLGTYMEDGIFPDDDLEFDLFGEKRWEDYYLEGVRLKKKLQEIMGEKTIIELICEQSGTPFHPVSP